MRNIRVVEQGTHLGRPYMVELCGPPDHPYYVGTSDHLATIGLGTHAEARRAIKGLIERGADWPAEVKK